MPYYDFIDSLKELVNTNISIENTTKKVREFLQEYANNNTLQCEINRKRCYLYYKVMIDRNFSAQSLFHTVNKTVAWPKEISIYNKELVEIIKYEGSDELFVSIPVTFNLAIPYFMDEMIAQVPESKYIQFPIVFPIKNVRFPDNIV
jgi:hypothetical protein